MNTPSRMPTRLHAVRHNDRLEGSINRIDEVMTDLLGPEWRLTLSARDAVTLTDIALTDSMEEH